MTNKVKKNGLGAVNPLVMVVFIILLAVALTYIIPAGTYETVTDAAGNKTINVENYFRVEQTPVGIASIPTVILKAFEKSISIIVIIAVGGGAFEVIRQTGAIDAIIGLTLAKSAGEEKKALWIVSFVFSLLGCTVAPQVFIPFAPMCIALAIALGYDDFTGTALLIISAAVGGIAGPLAAAIVAAQDMLGLPAYSGIIYRFLILIAFYLMSTFYLVRYAESVKKDAAKSVVWGLGAERDEHFKQFKDVAYPKMSLKHGCVIITMVLSFALMVYGGFKFGWGNYDIAGLFLVMGIVAGLASGMDLNKIAVGFTKGISQLTSTLIIIGLGTAVSNVLSKGNIIYTIIHFLCESLGKWPVFLAPIGLLFVIAIVNIFVPSINGKMPMLLPILSPVCKALGIEQQLLVICYTFGDSFTNFILPYQSGLVGFLTAGEVPFSRWMKFFVKLEVLWFVLGGVILLALQIIKIGPF